MNAATDSAPRAQRRLAPEVRRRQIVLEAARLISAAGFNAVSLADIADACDIRKPSVLHHFPSMAELLAAVLAYRDELSYPVRHEVEDFADPAAANEVFRSTVEDIAGILHTKDVVTHFLEHNRGGSLTTLVKPVLRVPDNMPADRLLGFLRDRFLTRESLTCSST